LTGVWEGVNERIRIGSICCDPVNWKDALARIELLANDVSQPHLVVTANIAHVEQSRSQRCLRKAYAVSSLATADGWPVVLLMRVLSGRHDIERVSGADLLPTLARYSYRIALIGGRDNAAALAAAQLQRQSGSNICLVESAPSEELESAGARSALLGRVRDAAPDLVFLGFGVPKQEEFAIELLSELSHGVVFCVGAALDFQAGLVKRAPIAVQRLGAEWLYRLLSEPGRLAKRYLSAVPVFAGVVMREVFRKAARSLSRYV